MPITGKTAMSKEICYWHEEMSEEIARRVLGMHFD